jgi:sugar phosphate isomerase/epimerase
MPHFRIALATRCLGQPLKTSVQIAAASGARGLQLDVRDELPPAALSETGRRQFLHQLNELGLGVASMIFPTRRGLVDQERLDARIAATRAAMDFAWQLRAKILVVRLGRIPDDPESPDYRLMHEIFNDLARHGNQVGVALAVTPAGESAEVLGNFLQSIQGGPTGVDFDPAAFILGGHDPVKALRLLHPLVMHFSARDAIREGDGSGSEVALGRGETDWVALLPLLDEIAYKGWVTVIRTQGQDRAGDLARAIEYLKNMTMS